jgi:peroxiredoxin
MPDLAVGAPVLGEPAPGFELRDQHGRLVSLSSFAGQRAAVLVFYPFAFTDVCTRELQVLRDQRDRFDNDDVALLAISCDSMFALRVLDDRDRLGFALLSDFWPHGQVASSYGVFDPERGAATRSTFVVDRAGILRWSVHNAMPDARDVEEYARAVADLV